MSIRTHSATTGPRAHQVSKRQRMMTIVIAGAVLIGALSGCSDGSSRDAELGKACAELK